MIHPIIPPFHYSIFAGSARACPMPYSANHKCWPYEIRKTHDFQLPLNDGMYFSDKKSLLREKKKIKIFTLAVRT